MYYKFKQSVKAGMDEVWEFFSDPANLELLTPADMHMRLAFPSEGKRVYAGMILHYLLRPAPLFRARWIAEITHVSEKEYFIDRQLAGPFRYWHHQHHFRETGSGVELTDIINYKAPFGIVGRLADLLFIKRKLRAMFRHRQSVIKKIFEDRG